MKRRVIGLLLAAVMLAGCGQMAVKPALPQSSLQPSQPEQEEPRSLTVYDPENKLGQVLEQYQKAQGVPVTKTQQPEQADLAMFETEPDASMAQDISKSAGLVHNLVNASPFYGFSMGGTVYGYVADVQILNQLLGEAPAVEQMSPAEWESFITAVGQWIDEPAGQSFNAGGKTWQLPAAKEGAAQNLEAVFAVEDETRYTGPVLSPVLATCFKTPADFAQNTDTSDLIGGLNSLFTLLGQEIVSLSKTPAPQAFAGGNALFCRTTLAKANQAANNGKQAVVIPLKFSFDETDLHGGLELDEILGQPVELTGGWLGIPAGADPAGTAEAESFLLWWHASEEGRKIPKNPSDGLAGLPDLSGAVSSEGIQAFDKLGSEQRSWDRDGRRMYTGGALDILEKEGAGNA